MLLHMPKRGTRSSQSANNRIKRDPKFEACAEEHRPKYPRASTRNDSALNTDNHHAHDNPIETGMARAHHDFTVIVDSSSAVNPIALASGTHAAHGSHVPDQ